MTKRIILTTLGSLGDLHPYIALGIGLKARGYQVTLATSAMYQQRILDQGLAFNPLHPNLPDIGDEFAMMRQVMNANTGTEYVLRSVVLPFVRACYEDLLPIVNESDLLISHPLTYATPIIAEKYQKPWVGVALQPIIFMSAYDPPVIPALPFLTHLRKLGPKFHKYLFNLFKWLSKSWLTPLYQLRQEIGLPPPTAHPIFEGIFSPHLNLALFSRLLAQPQLDWPSNVKVTGFPLFDKDEAQTPLDPQLAEFLRNGTPPIVFTLGSSAVMDAGNFYKDSMLAAQQLGQRAVLLIGRDPRNRPTQPLPKEILAVEYAPYSEVFRHAAAIVHQGGMGTTAQALYSGRPMLVMPYAHDQPDNAARVVRLGVGRTIAQRLYNSQSAAKELAKLLENKQYAEQAQQVGQQLQQEDGVAQACDAIDQFFLSRS